MKQLALDVKPSRSVKEFVRERLAGFYLRQDERNRRRLRKPARPRMLDQEQRPLEFEMSAPSRVGHNSLHLLFRGANLSGMMTEPEQRAALAILREYQSFEPPDKGAPAAYPAVADDGESPFEYIALWIEGRRRLAVLTPFEISGGPGREFGCIEAKMK